MKFYSYLKMFKNWSPGKRFLGLDMGSRYIGVAVSDPSNRIAIPLCTLKRDEKSSEKVRKELLTLIKKHRIQGVIVGVPATHPHQAQPYLDYISELWQDGKAIPVPVILQDETESTQEVAEYIGMNILSYKREIRTLKEKEKQLIDRLAAMNILQRGLDILYDYFKKNIPIPIKPKKKKLKKLKKTKKKVKNSDI